MRDLDPDPKKWSDDDRAWAAQRPEQYPAAAPQTGPDPSVVPVTDAAATGNAAPEDDYDTWNLTELKKEAKDRSGLVAPEGDQAKSKYAWIDALREWDRQNPVA